MARLPQQASLRAFDKGMHLADIVGGCRRALCLFQQFPFGIVQRQA